MTLSLRATALACALFAFPACSSDAPQPTCDGDSCDDSTPLVTPCDAVLADKSGRGFLPASLADDPLIALVYADDEGGCPVTAEAIIAKLKQTDKACDSGSDGLQTRAISEQAQLSGMSTGSSYRIITEKACGDRNAFEILFSMFGFADSPGAAQAGLGPTGNKLPPSGVEIVVFDRSDGVFNYYKEVGGKMGFFGSSLDFVTQGAGGPNLTSTRGCANCHTGGGLIMKELQAPWLHWEGTVGTTPGVMPLISNRLELLGIHSDAPALERLVRNGNAAWNKTRIAHMKDNGTVADLLRPLFCPVEVNVGNGDRELVPTNLVVDSQLGGGFLDIEPDHYDRALAAIGSQVAGTDKLDTVFAFLAIERSGADQAYVIDLEASGIVDRAFITDVLLVDFTRPVFSDDRCDLLAKAPTLAPADRTPAKIRDGFIANLDGAAAGTPAAQLLANLQANAAGKPVDPEPLVNGFLEACMARTETVEVDGGPVKGFVLDALKLRSLARKTAFVDGAIDDLRGSAQHPFKVFEFADTMPADKVQVTPSAAPGDPLRVHPEARLSPTDCRLVNEFVPAGG